MSDFFVIGDVITRTDFDGLPQLGVVLDVHRGVLVTAQWRLNDEHSIERTLHELSGLRLLEEPARSYPVVQHSVELLKQQASVKS